MPRRRLQKLTVLLLKSGLEDYESVVRDPSRVERYELGPNIPFEGAIYFRVPQARRPPWADFIASGTDEELPIIAGMANSALVFIEVGGSTFVFTFGRARGMISPGSYEPDFGLRVAINAIDPDRLRTVDVHTIEELTVHTRTQVSQESGLESFGIDPSRDLLRAVTGEPRDSELARRLTGADALAFAAHVEFPQLADKCREFQRISSLYDYKDRFGWIDHLRPVADPQLIVRLDDQLLNALTGPAAEQPHLAPPEPIEWDRIEGFSFPGEDVDAEPHLDMILDDYLLSTDLQSLSAETLRRDQVRVHWSDSAQVSDLWSVHDCLVHEAPEGPHLFVLTRGRWFQVDRQFAAEVEARVDGISAAQLSLPEARPSEQEADYNQRAAEACGGVLIDRTLVVPGSASSGIEPCDIFTRDGQFVHVKRWSRSATLSHLFAQGTVSGETFLRDPDFRTGFRDLIDAADPELTHRIPDGRPSASDFEVVFVVIGKYESRSLPFFSQLALSQAVDRLDLLGFRVATGFVAPASI